ncbi:hypothetical protein V1515DRAFT_363647 [Lipomyces mesembrius]
MKILNRRRVSSQCASWWEPQTKVLRSDGVGGFIETEVAMAEVVPGHLLNLRPGDIFRGDAVLIKSKDRFVSQSSLIGEFLPGEKSNDPRRR